MVCCCSKTLLETYIFSLSISYFRYRINNSTIMYIKIIIKLLIIHNVLRSIHLQSSYCMEYIDDCRLDIWRTIWSCIEIWSGVPIPRGGTMAYGLSKLPGFSIIVNRCRQRHMPTLDNISEPNFRSWQVPDVTTYLSERDRCSYIDKHNYYNVAVLPTNYV